MFDIVANIFTEAKAVERTLATEFVWPKHNEEDKDRIKQLVIKAQHAKIGADREEACRMLKGFRLQLGRKYRDCGVPRSRVAAIQAPDGSGASPWLLEGWDSRDTELRFWRRAYCA